MVVNFGIAWLSRALHGLDPFPWLFRNSRAQNYNPDS